MGDVAQTCPKCGLFNPPSAIVCDCGYDFVARRTTGRPSQSSRPGIPLICGCVADISPSEIEGLPPRNDSQVPRQLARRERRTWAGLAFVGAPVLAVYGFIDLNVVLPGPGWIALLIAPFAFGYGLFRFVTTKAGDPRDPEVLFAWLLSNRFLLVERHEMGSMWEFVLPSSANGYDVLRSRLRKVGVIGQSEYSASALEFPASEVRDLATQVRLDAGRGISCLRVPISVSADQGRRVIADLTLWAVRSRHHNWWAVIHSNHCIDGALDVVQAKAR